MATSGFVHGPLRRFDGTSAFFAGHLAICDGLFDLTNALRNALPRRAASQRLQHGAGLLSGEFTLRNRLAQPLAHGLDILCVRNAERKQSDRHGHDSGREPLWCLSCSL